MIGFAAAHKLSYSGLTITFLDAGMRQLPFMNGIKAFEAAARTGSFAKAAEELHVTPAAVSRMVHLLEDRLSAMDESLRGARDRVDDYTLALMEHGRRATISDIEWLDGLIQAERSRGVATPGGRRRRSAALRRKETTS